MEKKNCKVIFDIRPVLVSKKDHRIIEEKRGKERKILLPKKFSERKYLKKTFFRKVIDLKTICSKKEIPILKLRSAKVSDKIKRKEKLIGLKERHKVKIGRNFDIRVREKFLDRFKNIEYPKQPLKVETKSNIFFPVNKNATSKAQSYFLNIFSNYNLKKRLFSFKLPLFKRSFGVFTLISFFLVSSVQGLASFHKDLILGKEKILDETAVAYQYLLSGGNSFLEKDYDLASYKFNVAAERFISAQKELNRINDIIIYLLKIIPGGSVVSSGKYLLEAGANISLASKCMAQAFVPFSKTEDIFAEVKKLKSEKDFNKISFTLALAEAFENLQRAEKNLKEAEENLEKVNPDDFPESMRPEVLKIKIALPTLVSAFEYFVSHADALLEILGHNKPKKYLLLFENNRELRPTGGFIGTYSLFDMKEGKIENLKVEGPYGIDGQLKEKYIAPEPLRLIQPRFFMHDANWFLDFPTSAKKIILLHEKAGGPTVDGVAVFTASVLQDLLKITGPIEMPEYGVTINADNFYDETQREVEIEYDKELNEPKKFIADLLPRFFEKLASQEKQKWADIVNVFSKKLIEKQILIYFTDERLEKLVQELGFAGEVKAPSKDYLSVVASNIGGGKTDHAIEQQIFHFSEIQPDGSIIDTVKIKRKHNGDKNDFWTSVKNMCFLRIYVPQGSKLIEASGFDSEFYNILLPPIEGSIPDPLIGQIERDGFIHEPSKVRVTREGNKTVFGNFIGVEVGQEKEIVLKYQLPFKIILSDEHTFENYSLFIQKQPGTLAFKFSSELHYPSNFNLIWQHPENNELKMLKNGAISYETNLNTDKIYAVIFKR